MRPLPSQARLKELFDYDPETGLLTNKTQRRGCKRGKGETSGNVGPLGYSTTMVNRISYLNHRLAWKWFYGHDPVGEVDHIDGDPKNNAIKNLRIATKAENMSNTNRRADRSTHGKGVYRNHVGKYWVQVTCEGVTHYGGCFDSPEDAFQVACDLRNKLHGEFANHE